MSNVKHDWRALKKEYMTRRLAGEVIDGPGFCKKHNINYPRFRNKLHEDGWVKEALRLINERDKRVQEAVLEQSAKALTTLQTTFVTSEVEIRKRHAMVARGMIVKGWAKLKTIKPEDLTARDAALLLQIGLQEERRAVGLPDSFTFVPAQLDAEGKYKPVVEHIAEAERMQQLGRELLTFIDGTSKRIKNDE